MNIKQSNPNLIDLMHTKAYQLDLLIEDRWNEKYDLYLSMSEWKAISLAYRRGKIPVAEVAKGMDISRQATHKLIRNLERKGLLAISQLENNKKAKSIQLTKEGVSCYEKKEVLKKELEKEMVGRLGEAQIQVLKETLKQDWGI